MPARAWKAGPHEAAIVARLLVAFRDHYGGDWPSENAFASVVERLMDDPRTEYLLGAREEGGPAEAVCQLRYRLSVWTASDDCWLEDLFVEEGARGSGLGEAMVTAALDRARSRGCRRVELDVDAGNAPARALYEKQGFKGKNDGALFLQARIWENYPEERRPPSA